jgi:uncharacterized protein YlbG (UPF0298 family)
MDRTLIVYLSLNQEIVSLRKNEFFGKISFKEKTMNYVFVF